MVFGQNGVSTWCTILFFHHVHCTLYSVAHTQCHVQCTLPWLETIVAISRKDGLYKYNGKLHLIQNCLCTTKIIPYAKLCFMAYWPALYNRFFKTSFSLDFLSFKALPAYLFSTKYWSDPTYLMISRSKSIKLSLGRGFLGKNHKTYDAEKSAKPRLSRSDGNRFCLGKSGWVMYRNKIWPHTASFY